MYMYMKIVSNYFSGFLLSQYFVVISKEDVGII